MSKVSDLVGDAMADESLRALIIATENDDLRFAAYNGNVTSVTKIADAAMDASDGFSAPYVMIRAKDITDLLSTFRSLKRTKVKEVEINITQSGAQVIMHEEPASDSMVNADKYNQNSRFKVRMMDVRPAIAKELQSVDMTPKGVQLDSKSFLAYINALLPTVVKEKRLLTNSITFGPESVYTFLATYMAIMPNHLPGELNGFRLTNTMAGFVKSFIGSEETFGFYKEEKGKGAVLITLFTSDSVAVLKAGDMSQANDISQFSGIPDTGVVVDKAYLLDVLKRIAMAGAAEKVVVTATIENGMGTLSVATKNMKQEIPLVAAKGTGVFSFDIQGETLGNVIFAHTNMFDENVFLYLDHTADGRSTMLCCTDNTSAWTTRMPRLSNVASGYDW